MDRFNSHRQPEPVVVSARARLHLAGAGLSALLVAGCGGTLGPLTGGEEPRTTTPAGPAPSPNAVRVGLILPLTGAGATVAQGLRNAAELSVSQFDNPNIALVIKDDGGTPEGARRSAAGHRGRRRNYSRTALCADRRGSRQVARAQTAR